MKRNLYIVCSLLSILLWGASTVYFIKSKSKLTPETMASWIQKDVAKQEQDLKDLLSNKNLMSHLWQNNLSEAEFNYLSGKKYTIQLYENGRLSFWNRNDFAVTEMSFLPRLTVLQEHYSTFLYQSFGKADYPHKRINVIIPMFTHYDVNNEYLRSNFTASSLIPASSRINLQKTPGAFLISSKENKPLFYVSINNGDIEPLKPDFYLLLLIVISIIVSIVAIQLLANHLGRRYKSWLSIVFVFAVVAFVRCSIYFFGLPYNLEDMELFSPQIFATNDFLPSFGHLFLHVLCIYWVLSFIISKRFSYSSLKGWSMKTVRFWLVFLVAGISVFAFSFYLQHLVQSIVFDSDISFDTNTFNATDKFTLLSLIIIAIIARLFFLSLQFINSIFSQLFSSDKVKYMAFSVGGLLLLVIYKMVIPSPQSWMFMSKEQAWLDLFTFFWAALFIYISDRKYLKVAFSRLGLFSLIFLSVYFSLLFAIYFKFFIDEKEMTVTRVAFAEKLSRQQDTELEIKFDGIEKDIEEDAVLQDWMEHGDSVSSYEVYKHFKVFNSALFYTRYNQDIYLFNDSGNSIIAGEHIPIDSFEKIKSFSLPTLNKSLFFRIDSSEQKAYLVYLPIFKTSTHSLLGYFVINFKLKQNINQAVYPSVLENYAEQDDRKSERYNYAIYINRKLGNQSGSYNFVPVRKDEARDKISWYETKGEFSEYYYKSTDNIIYVVVYKNNILLGILTIFSFLFGLSLFISILENWISYFTSGWFAGKKMKMIYKASMSVRVKYFALGFTVISFFVIGLSTVIFLTNRYQTSSVQNIENCAANVSESITEYLQNRKTILAEKNLRDQIASSDFAFFLSNIAQQQKMDINIFDTHGQLSFTTQENIYEANVLGVNMSASAFHTLRQKNLYGYIQPEKIGALQYTASYSPIYNHENKIIGYLNIPSFFTKQHLDNQIVSLITTLVNIYTILLLISSVITFLFINTLTKSLRLVADSLKNVSLKNNELINWPYEDEIGLLVREYNKMVATVEKNARSLVLDERQNAWREMAQQVAHEIKNPLTPMKLNIQYLQQAINSNHPDIINLTKRVSSSIIEQIDNLNYIASEFSNFAKMPENKTERIDLKSMLERIVLLFAGNKNLTITHSFPTDPVIVFADKSQMLRIFTNIVQNAVESIPTEEKAGLVDVQLLLHEEQNSVTIKVKDNGTGIPEEVKDKIFDPYFTTKSSGTGLGLAMTKKIIELWGGAIKFESVENEGTTFLLTVPLG